MIRKIYIFFKYIFTCKFIFKIPKRKVIIFDCEGPALKRALTGFNYFILSTRSYKITKIYISKNIITFILANFFNRSVKQNYLIALTKEIDPKVVITHIDNSPDFYIVSRILSKNIKFIAVQQANRETKWLPSKERKKIYIPEYLCLAGWDKNIYKTKTKVKKIMPIGSLNVSLALSHVKKRKLKINKNEYDICLIGEPEGLEDANKHILTAPWVVATTAKFVQKFCKKYKLKLIFASKGPPTSRARRTEKKVFKDHNVNCDFKFTRMKNPYSSYICAMKSKVIVGLFSTVIRESLALNKKIFHCNFTGYTDSDFPIREKFSLKKGSYNIFEKKLRKILRMSNKKYFSDLGKQREYLMHPSKNTLRFLRQKILQYVHQT